MNRWLVIHRKEAFSQHNNLIGCKTIKYRKRIITKPITFLEVRKGDLIVYYMIGKLIIGIFKVISDIEYLNNDAYWGNMAIYRIEPLLKPKKPIPIQGLLQNPKNKFDLFKNKKYWGSYLQGKSIVNLTNSDFELFFNYIKKKSE